MPEYFLPKLLLGLGVVVGVFVADVGVLLDDDVIPATVPLSIPSFFCMHFSMLRRRILKSSS